MLLIFDALSNTMALVIILISLLVHKYSAKYLQSDPHLVRFLSYLSLFTFFMLILVNAANFLVMFLG